MLNWIYMNKSFLVSIIVFLLVLAGGVVYYTQFMDTNSDQGIMTEESIENDDQMMDDDHGDSMMNGETYHGNLLGLLSIGQDYTCTYSRVDTNGATQDGTVYVAASGDKMKGEFTINVNGEEPKQSFVIRDGEYTYVWSDYFEGGYKTKIESDTNSLFSTDEEATSNMSAGVSEDNTYNFDCEPWTVDDSMFVPPSKIEFTDINAQMEELMEQTNSAIQEQCSACDEITDSTAQEQCRAALSC